jgi:hypothetical protein
MFLGCSNIESSDFKFSRFQRFSKLVRITNQEVFYYILNQYFKIQNTEKIISIISNHTKAFLFHIKKLSFQIKEYKIGKKDPC